MDTEYFDNDNNGLVDAEATQPGVPLIAVLLGLALLVSMGLHAWTIATLMNIRATARSEMLALTTEIAAARTDTIDLEVPIRQVFPVSTVVQVQENLAVPINTTVNINQQVSFPIVTPVGSTVVAVPIQATVPISTTVPVTIDETFPISTEVLIDMQLPVSLPIDQTPIGSYLEQLQLRLEKLVSEL